MNRLEQASLDVVDRVRAAVAMDHPVAHPWRRQQGFLYRVGE